MLSADPRDVNAFHDAINRIVDERIAIALKKYDQNMRPKGAANLPLCIGTNGTPLVAKLWINGFKVPFPMVIDEVHISADAVSDTTFDLQVQRHALGQTVTDAASIVNGHYPRLLDPILLTPVQEIVINPSVAPITTPPVWSSIYLEGGSLLFLYVTITDGLCGTVTFNVLGRPV